MMGRSPSWSSQAARWVSRGVHPIPRGGHGRPVPGGHRARGDLRIWPRRGVGQGQLAAVLAGPAIRAGLARRRRQLHYPVGPQPPEQLHRQICEQEGQPGHVIPGVEDCHEDRHPRLGSAGGDQSLVPAGPRNRTSRPVPSLSNSGRMPWAHFAAIHAAVHRGQSIGCRCVYRPAITHGGRPSPSRGMGPPSSCEGREFDEEGSKVEGNRGNHLE
jgi:hypothetical protein